MPTAISAHAHLGFTSDTSQSASWPEEPPALTPGSGSRQDRRRMLQQMREYWKQVNAERSSRVMLELKHARERQTEANAYWNAHKAAVKARWHNRAGGRGRTTVADVPEIAGQWDPSNPHSPREVLATAQTKGVLSPYRWQCPLFPDEHTPWAAWPKDRVPSGSGCPACRKLTRLSDLPTLAAQYQGPSSAEDLAYGSQVSVPWQCRTWAVDPETGQWHKVEHHFKAVIKSRALQQDSCLVCAGYCIDDTNSLWTWFPELADELDDPCLDARRMSTSQHNARGARHGERPTYATVPWRCRHDHKWEATVLNRVQGSDCRDCSTSGVSKQQVRLAAELAGLFDLVQPTPRDPRLDAAVTDFASHRLSIPEAHKPVHWRYRDVEVDILLRLPEAGGIIGVEYDGAYHHSSQLRSRHNRREEGEKSAVLAAAGLTNALVHVRIGDLKPVEGEHALTVALAEGSSPHEQACAVAALLQERFPGSCPGLKDYRSGGVPTGQHQAEAYIVAVWGEIRPPRRPRPKKERSPRALTASVPSADSWLTPNGEPYRNPDKPSEIVRDYQCRCGNSCTAVQSQVSYGTTTSCGCRAAEARRNPRLVITPAETQEVRTWAKEQGIAIGRTGRTPGRLVASFRMARAGYQEHLGSDGLLHETPVKAWATQNEHPLGVRGRITSDLWLHYAADILSGVGRTQIASE
ncbi:hypothetical protein ABZX65_23780 [Streptomyces sp. NPDC003300]|uniref:zinc-ribbon domain-containing protein n=1 Tax=unclassified Streptomyces TaxID=2593676 RepID=UPI0033BA19A7